MLQDEISEYCKDRYLIEMFIFRAQLEKEYIKQLSKITKKYGTERKGLGGIGNLWHSLVLNAAEEIKNHSNFSERLTADILNMYKENEPFYQDMSGIKIIESTLNKLSKEFDEKEGKQDKAKKALESAQEKNNKTEKLQKQLSQATTAFSTISENWKLAATPHFSKFEAMHKKQIDFVKSILEAYCKLQSSNLKSNLQEYEQTLKTIGDIDAEKELVLLVSEKSNESNQISPDEVSESISTPNPEKASRTNLATVDAPPSAPTALTAPSAPEVIVDEEGYRVPQMSHKQWISESIPTSTDEDGDTKRHVITLTKC